MKFIEAVALTVFSLFSHAAQAECFCGEESFYYAPADIDEADYMEDFLWEVVEVSPIYDLTSPEEPIVSCYVEVSMVWDDHPAIDTLRLSDEADDPVLFSGVWMSYEAFEANLLAVGCTQPAAS